MVELFKKDTPINEQRISWIETVVSRLARRSKKNVTAITTPYPISACITGEDVRGDILKYMFCARGTISRGLVDLGKRPSTGVVIGITISNDIGGSSKSYVITKKAAILEPSIKVFSGDKLSISVEPIDKEKDTMTEVWIAFMWTPHINEVDMKQVLIDSLDGGVDVPEE